MPETCRYLARIGFDSILGELGAAEWTDEAARMVDHAKVRAVLLGKAPAPRNNDLLGAKWFRMISWPDRMPGLKTWAGQSSLPKIIAAHQKRLAASKIADLFAANGVYRTSKGEGPSGFDAGTCPNPIDVGFSLSAVGVDIQCFPGVELLAIVGLDSVPIVSFGLRECGFVHNGEVWRFKVEHRSGYYYRWGLNCERMVP